MYHAAPGLYCRSGHWIDGRTARGADGVGERVDGDFARIAEFVLEIDKLKNVIRRTKPAALDRYENSAEHSWHVALLAALLAGQAAEPVDTQHVVEILLVHDIPEVDAGDTFLYGQRDASVAEAETRAAERLFGILPDHEAAWCMDRWLEYEERATPEGRFAYAADRLMPLLHNLGSGGAGWIENRVPVERVLEMNAPIGDVFPEIWEQVRSAVVAHAEQGGFDFD